MSLQRFFAVRRYQSSIAKMIPKIFDLIAQLLARRPWSFSACPAPRAICWSALLPMIQNAQQLKENVCFAVNHPARLMMDAFESVDYDHRRLRGYGHKTSVVLGQNHKEAGKHLLQTLIRTFPDNKIVEDVHNALRLEARVNKNNKLTPLHELWSP